MSSIRIPENTEVVFRITTRHPISGSITSADETPHYWVFEQTSHTGVLVRQPMIPHAGFSGVYRGNFTASTGNNFSTEKWYNVMPSAKVNGVIDMNIVQTIFLEKNIYYADISLDVDTSGSKDEYTVQWYKDDTPFTNTIGSPTIQVIKRSDGTDLVSSTVMSAIGSTGAYKYDESSNRISTGESYIVVATATIDGSSRSFRKNVWRDN